MGMVATNGSDGGKGVKGTIAKGEEGDNSHGGREVEVGDGGGKVVAGTETMKKKSRRKRARGERWGEEEEVDGSIVEEAGGVVVAVREGNGW